MPPPLEVHAKSPVHYLKLIGSLFLLFNQNEFTLFFSRNAELCLLLLSFMHNQIPTHIQLGMNDLKYHETMIFFVGGVQLNDPSYIIGFLGLL